MDAERNEKLDFGRLSGRGVKVAVVDSGVRSDHPGIGDIAGGVGLAVGEDGGVIATEEWGDLAGHGTACAGIIRHKAGEAELYSVRIFDDSLMGDGQALLAALEWCIEREMDVVNLSLGTTDPGLRNALRTVCRRAVEAGVILVAAQHNEGRESWPAIFPEVIGVGGEEGGAFYEYRYCPDEKSECVARGDSQRVCWLEPDEVMVGGTSFAAPHISGIVALIRQAYPGARLEKVRELLRLNAAEVVEPRRDIGESTGGLREVAACDGGGKYGWIGKAALYPFNKEMHALVRGRDLLEFEIVGIADPAGRGMVGKDAGEELGIGETGLRIRASIDAVLEDADTLILGYVDELGRLARRDLLRESIRKGLERGCHVFSLLAVPQQEYADLYELARCRGLRIAYPAISTAEVLESVKKFGNAEEVDVPVVGVFGTSSQQGKFTLQLLLRRRLLEMGYRVGQIGTEHHAELFGMDLAFPMGYASPLEFPLQHYVPYLDAKMREICRSRRPDIVLVGAQSGTVPYDVHQPRTHTLASLAFLLGVRPDACVLVVNSIDPDEYIRDTIDGLQALARVPTILLAMGDREKHVRTAYGRTWMRPRRMAEEEIERKLGELEDRFGLPAICITSGEGEERLARTVVDYFAEEEESCRNEVA